MTEAREMPSTDTSFTSPTGRYIVTFKRLANVYNSPNVEIDEVNNIQYTVEFLEKLTSRHVKAYFTDVFNRRPPSILRNIYKYMSWSPKDDIVIFLKRIGNDIQFQ